MIRSMPEDFREESPAMLLVSGFLFIRRVRVMKGIREIAITDMPEVSIGNVQSDEAKTGVTVLLFDKKGAVVGVDTVVEDRPQGNSADFSGYSG